MKNEPIGQDTMSSAMRSASAYHRWISELAIPWLKGKGLEVGCGFGQYTKEFAHRVKSLTVVDCDPQVLIPLRSVAANVQTQVATLAADGFLDSISEETYDVAICINVLEHIENDVLALEQLHAILKPGGRLLLFVPAHPALYGPMDRLAGHFRRYSKNSLRLALGRVGYSINEIRYFNPLGGLGWWLNAKLASPTSLSDDAVNSQILFFDQYILPLSRMVDPFTRRVFGQSLWVVAKRPEINPSA